MELALSQGGKLGHINHSRRGKAKAIVFPSLWKKKIFVSCIPLKCICLQDELILAGLEQARMFKQWLHLLRVSYSHFYKLLCK